MIEVHRLRKTKKPMRKSTFWAIRLIGLLLNGPAVGFGLPFSQSSDFVAAVSLRIDVPYKHHSGVISERKEEKVEFP